MAQASRLSCRASRPELPLRIPPHFPTFTLAPFLPCPLSLRQSYSTSDFNSGIRWAGITEIRTTNNTAVTKHKLTSSSGFDYGAGVSPAPPQFTQINLVPEGGISLQWTDSFARAYTVETTPILPATNWVPAPGVLWPITTNWVNLTAPVVSNAFFRLRAQ